MQPQYTLIKNVALIYILKKHGEDEFITGESLRITNVIHLTSLEMSIKNLMPTCQVPRNLQPQAALKWAKLRNSLWQD